MLDLSTLVITVDVPINSKRERNLRNGFTRPLKLTMRTKLEALLHPGWMAEYLRAGMPLFSNWQQYAPPGASVAEIADFVADADTRAGAVARHRGSSAACGRASS